MSDITSDDIRKAHDRLFGGPTVGQVRKGQKKVLESLEQQRQHHRPLREEDIGLWIDRLTAPAYSAEIAKDLLEERRVRQVADSKELSE